MFTVKQHLGSIESGDKYLIDMLALVLRTVPIKFQIQFLQMLKAKS